MPRTHLLERLDAGLRGRLTLVAAPAGFGKSTLIARWGRQLAESGLCQLAWLSLDARDDDLVHFFSYVIAALQTVDRFLGVSALELLQSPQIDDIHVVLTTLLSFLWRFNMSANVNIMQTERQSTRTTMRRLLWVGPLAVVAATAANLALYYAAGALFPAVTAWPGAGPGQIAGACSGGASHRSGTWPD